MKQIIKTLLKWLGIDKEVGIYLTNRRYQSYYHTHNFELKFYRQFKPLILVFDIGSNKGDKANIFQQLSQKTLCVDPDESNIAIIRSRFNIPKKVIAEQVAVGDVEGEATFYMLEEGQQLNTLSQKWKQAIEQPANSRFPQSRRFEKEVLVNITTLDALIRKYGRPDYIKIDVEGYELQVLKGLNEPVKLLSFESNLPEFLAETLECVDRLRSFSEQPQFNISVNCSMLLSEWVPADVIKEKIKRLKDGTYEVFYRNEKR